MKTSRFALAAVATALMSTSALAADLGGNCCADLEERIAELEATTVRKGNRKVSLQISGYVSHHVMHWDDGIRSDTYIGDGGNYGSRWRFRGEAKINPELTAGFLYEYGISENSIGAVDQEHRNTVTARNNGDDLVAPTFALRDTTVWLRHSRLGMVKIGHGSTATDNLVLIDLGNLGGSSTPDQALYGGGMRMANSSLGAVESYSPHTWTSMIRGHESWDTTRRNHVLYETPTLHGFSLQAAVAEDNYWDIALRYAGEFNGVRVAFGIGYQEDSEFNTRTDLAAFGGGVVRCTLSCDQRSTDLKGAASILHTSTGLFLTGSYGEREMENLQFAAGGPRVNRDGSYWHLAGGVSRNFFGIGSTTLFAEYGNHKDMLAMTSLNVTSSDATNWGLGINQTIDAAAMDIFLVYKSFEGDYVSDLAVANSQVVGRNQMKDLSMFILGTRISF